MQEGGDIKDQVERRDLWDRALKRPDRHVERTPEREARAPQRQMRTTRNSSRK